MRDMNGVGMRRFLATVIAAAVGLSSVLGSQTAAAQTRSRLDPRIPAPLASKYKDILDAKDWLNPSIVIRSDGIEVVSRGLPGRRKTVPTTALRDLLVSLPLADWPYGRVVMASDIGLRRADRSDDESIQRNHDAAERILKDLDVTFDWWPPAAPVQATTHRHGADHGVARWSRASADVFVSGAGPLPAGVRGIILVVHDTGSGSRRRLTVA